MKRCRGWIKFISLLFILYSTAIFSSTMEEFLGFTPISVSRLQKGSLIYIGGSHFEYLVNKKNININKSNTPMVIITGDSARHLSNLINQDPILKEFFYISTLHDNFIVLAGLIAEKMFQTIELFVRMEGGKLSFSSHDLSIILEDNDFFLSSSIFNYFRTNVNEFHKSKSAIQLMGFNQDSESQILSYVISILSSEMGLSSSIIFLRGILKCEFLKKFNFKEPKNSSTSDWIALVVGKLSKDIYLKSPFSYLGIDFAPGMVQIYYSDLANELYRNLQNEYGALRIGTYNHIIVTGRILNDIIGKVEEKYYNSRFGKDFIIASEDKFNKFADYLSEKLSNEDVYLMANFLNSHTFTICDTLTNIASFFEETNNLFYTTKSIHTFPKGNVVELNIS